MPCDCACVRFSSLSAFPLCVCVCCDGGGVCLPFLHSQRPRCVVFWFASVQFAIVCASWMCCFLRRRGSTASFNLFGFKANVKRIIIYRCFGYNVKLKNSCSISTKVIEQNFVKLSCVRIGGFMSVAGEKPKSFKLHSHFPLQMLSPARRRHTKRMHSSRPRCFSFHFFTVANVFFFLRSF